ncbi:glucosamine-6-phosphate deaminase [Candidatus Omnitrophota bacterium]
MSKLAADIVVDTLRKKPNAVIGITAGQTPIGMYKELVERHKRGEVDFSEAIFVQPDSYILDPAHPQSFRSYLFSQFFSMVNAKEGNIHLLEPGREDNLEEYCRQYEKLLKDNPVDIMILGIGSGFYENGILKGGHIGFNEPGSQKFSRTRVVGLAHNTRKDAVKAFKSIDSVPEKAVTMGIETLLSSKNILLLANGIHKANVVRAMLEGEVTPNVPASFLQKHDSTLVILDKFAATELKKTPKTKPGKSPEDALKVITASTHLHGLLEKGFTLIDYFTGYDEVRAEFMFERLADNPESTARRDLEALVNQGILTVDKSAKSYKYKYILEGKNTRDALKVIMSSTFLEIRMKDPGGFTVGEYLWAYRVKRELQRYTELEPLGRYPRSKARRYLKKLVEKGILTVDKSNKAHKYTLIKIDAAQTRDHAKGQSEPDKDTSEKNQKTHRKTAPKPLMEKADQPGKTDTLDKINSYYGKFIESNVDLISTLLGESREKILLRVPIEIIETVGVENIKSFLSAFQKSRNGYVELYSSKNSSGEVSDVHDIIEKALPEYLTKKKNRSRTNTITVFPVSKDEEISQATIRTKVGLKSTDTILSPMGLQQDPAGLIRSTLLGLSMVYIARQKEGLEEIDEDFLKKTENFLRETAVQYEKLCISQGIEGFNLKTEDIIKAIIDIATGNNPRRVIGALKKLIDLLPITPIDVEELRKIHEHAARRFA